MTYKMMFDIPNTRFLYKLSSDPSGSAENVGTVEHQCPIETPQSVQADLDREIANTFDSFDAMEKDDLLATEGDLIEKSKQGLNEMIRVHRSEGLERTRGLGSESDILYASLFTPRDTARVMNPLSPGLEPTMSNKLPPKELAEREAFVSELAEAAGRLGSLFNSIVDATMTYRDAKSDDDRVSAWESIQVGLAATPIPMAIMNSMKWGKLGKLGKLLERGAEEGNVIGDRVRRLSENADRTDVFLVVDDVGKESLNVAKSLKQFLEEGNTSSIDESVEGFNDVIDWIGQLKRNKAEADDQFDDLILDINVTIDRLRKTANAHPIAKRRLDPVIRRLKESIK